MRNETDVANLALTMLGKSMIVSMDEQTQTAAICRQHYDDARRAQLSRSDWIFARAVQAAPEVADPAPYQGWRKFALPSDVVKLRAVSSADGTPYHPGQWTGPEFRADGRYISVAGDTAVVSYIRDATEVDAWPPLFAETVAYKLASMIAVAVTGRLRDANDAMQLAEAMLQRAIEVDASQERSTYAKTSDAPLGPLTQDWPITPGHMHGVLPPGTEVITSDPPAPLDTDYVAIYEAAKQ